MNLRLSLPRDCVTIQPGTFSKLQLPHGGENENFDR